MKKLFYLLFLLPLAFFSSCSNDDDLAEVDITTTLSGVTEIGETFYTVVGDTISIDSISVSSLTDKAAAVTGVRYFFDGYPIFGTIEAPFNFKINTEGVQEGTHTLAIAATVLQVDKSITSVALNYPVKIVLSEEDLPQDAPEIGTYSVTARLQAK